MSDAITLDVLSSSPVQLDVGDADPIAREEIAELATRVTTVEGDVSGLSTRMGAVEGDISTLGTTVDGIDARVEAIEADYVTSEDVMGALGGEAPTLVAGSSRAMLGDPETASWMERTTAADGAALIEAVYGRTLVWNQLITNGDTERTGAVSGSYMYVRYANATEGKVAGHKYLFMVHAYADAQYSASLVMTDNITETQFLNFTIGSSYEMYAAILTAGYSYSSVTFSLRIRTNTGVTGLHAKNAIAIDLTAMFGAGKEPATVAEFATLFPEPYYPYDAGTLLPVRMEGVETVAADESWSSQRTIPASTYFPQGMRSAGTVCDELRADAAVTRVGERAYQSGDESDASVITDGTVTHYALTTPTVTPIDPPLPMSYRTGAGGTERVMVADGTTSAPPIFMTRYPLDPADLAASIAPRESAIAKTNHQVGDLLMLGFALCKATQVIVTGETIAIGTNVTRTSVAAELAALSQ